MVKFEPFGRAGALWVQKNFLKTYPDDKSGKIFLLKSKSRNNHKMQPETKNSRAIVVGWMIFIISSVLWLFAIFVAPFLPFAFKTKAIIFGITYVLSQVTFYISIALLGKDFLSKLCYRCFPKKQDPEKLLPDTDRQDAWFEIQQDSEDKATQAFLTFFYSF